MQFLVLAKPRSDLFAKGAPADFQQLLQQEQARSRSAYAEGWLRQIWLRQTGNGAVAIVEAASLEEAEALLKDFPMYRAGYLETEIVPLAPYSGFAGM
jgi:muconolactone delta-isomerase